MQARQQTAAQRPYGPLVIALVAVLLAGLPLAAWLDMRALADRILNRQADEISRVIDDMRAYYAEDVIGRIIPGHEAIATHNYKSSEGAIPIPATLSIELGQRISARNDAVKYRFVSDFPFKGRDPHQLDDFEKNAIAPLPHSSAIWCAPIRWSRS